MKEKLLAILDKNINQEQLAKDVLMEIVLAQVEAFVADSSNPYDDMLVKAIKEFLEAKVA